MFINFQSNMALVPGYYSYSFIVYTTHNNNYALMLFIPNELGTYEDTYLHPLINNIYKL